MRIDDPRPQPGLDPAHVARATGAAVEFERFFIGHMLRTMRASTRALAGDDSVFNDRVNRDMQDMADDVLAGHLAGRRAFGIADAVLRQLLPAPAATKKPVNGLSERHEPVALPGYPRPENTRAP